MSPRSSARSPSRCRPCRKPPRTPRQCYAATRLPAQNCCSDRVVRRAATGLTLLVRRPLKPNHIHESLVLWLTGQQRPQAANSSRGMNWGTYWLTSQRITAIQHASPGIFAQAGGAIQARSTTSKDVRKSDVTHRCGSAGLDIQAPTRYFDIRQSAENFARSQPETGPTVNASCHELQCRGSCSMRCW